MCVGVLPQEAISHFRRVCEYKRLEILCSLVKQGDRILDVGCGIGTYTSIPLSYLPINIMAIDSDKETIEYSKERNDRKNLEYVCSSGEFYYTKAKFDVIVCSHILEHIPDPRRLLLNMGNLLQGNGVLYVAIPNGFGWFEMQNLLPRMMCKTQIGKSLVNRMMGSAKDTLSDSHHVHFFTVPSIKMLLESTGWRVVSQYNDEFLGGILLDRILARLPLLAKWNGRIADFVPLPLANGWIFVCRKAL